MIFGNVVTFVPIGAHLAVTVIFQVSGLDSNAARAVNPIVQDIRAHLFVGFEGVRQSSPNCLASIKKVIRDKADMVSFKPLATVAFARSTLAQRTPIECFCIADTPRINTVLQQIADHLFINRLLTGAELLNDWALVHPVGDLLVAVRASCIKAEGTPHSRCLSAIQVESSGAFICSLLDCHQIVAERRLTAIELSLNGALALAALGFAAQILRVEG